MAIEKFSEGIFKGGASLEDILCIDTSDFHFNPGEKLSIRLLNGELNKANSGIIDHDKIEQILSIILSEREYEKLRENDEIDTIFETESSRYRVNVCSAINPGGEDSYKISIRKLPKRIPSIEATRFPTPLFNYINQQVGSGGLVLFTGETGSGKSTTQAAIVNSIARNSGVHIVTIEDPIEYIIKTEKSIVTQRQIGRNVKSYEEGIINALRQDPDIILIGELRETEEIRQALHAALTGHLVFGTFHANNSLDVVEGLALKSGYDKMEALSTLRKTLKFVGFQKLVEGTRKNRILALEYLIPGTAEWNYFERGKATIISPGKHYQPMNAILNGLRQQGLISDTTYQRERSHELEEKGQTPKIGTYDKTRSNSVGTPVGRINVKRIPANQARR